MVDGVNDDRDFSMTGKRSFIDHQQLATRFEVGDRVYYVDPHRMRRSPHVGVVTKVHRGIGFVDVDFGWGNERITPEELAPAETPGAEDGPDDPVEFMDDQDQRTAMCSHDLAKSLARHYRQRVSHLYLTANHFCEQGIEQMDTYHTIYKRYMGEFSDFEIKHAVKTAFEAPEQIRKAMYWKEKGRQYVPTQQELDTGCFHCPRCKSVELEQTIYKKWTKLYACRECLFLIKPADILDSLDDAAREEAEEQLGWSPSVSDPAKAFNEWL